MLRLGNTITHKFPFTDARNMKKFEGQSIIIVGLLTATGVSIREILVNTRDKLVILTINQIGRKRTICI